MTTVYTVAEIDGNKVHHIENVADLMKYTRHVREQAAAEERAKIVAWLRENSTLTGYHWGVSIINAIEAGEHLK